MASCRKVYQPYFFQQSQSMQRLYEKEDKSRERGSGGVCLSTTIDDMVATLVSSQRPKFSYLHKTELTSISPQMGEQVRKPLNSLRSY